MGRLGPFEENTIVVGDCLDIMAQMPDGCVDLVVTSPPYWRAKDYRMGGALGRGQSYPDYLTALRCNFREVHRTLKEHRYCAVVIDHFTVDKQLFPIPFDLAAIMDTIGFVFHIPIIWVKPLGVQGMWKSGATYSLKKQRPFIYYPNHNSEHILLFRKGEHLELDGETDLRADELKAWLWDVWKIRTVANEHPCPFPEEIVYRLSKLYSFPDDLIFDPFMGSGTTAVVADRLGRKFFGCDINPDYVEMALERLEKDRAGRQLALL